MDRVQRLASMIIVAACASATAELPISKTAGCLEGPMAQFGQYLGSWDIADTQLANDGSGWAPGPGARWDFVCIGDGAAVQDFWIPNGGNVGTNLRTYHPETQSWDIAWAIKPAPGFTHITAALDPDTGNIVMHYKSPLPTPPRRITFFPADADGWKWHLEMSFDDEKTWTQVYRINATRRK